MSMNSFNSFKEWLIAAGNGTSTVKSIVSRISRINDEYSIEYEYEKDCCAALLKDFTYTTDDAKNGVIPSVSIKIKGDYFTGLQSLKRALVLYIDYLGTTKSVVSNNHSCLPSCTFTGNFSQFNKYTGPMWRNKVQMITKALKKSIAVCECCRQKKELQAAHKHGFERLDIIKSILVNNYQIAPDYFCVDLAEFECKFIDAHKLNKDIFYFLCQDCHKIYDNDDIVESNKIISTVLSNRKIFNNKLD